MYTDNVGADAISGGQPWSSNTIGTPFSTRENGMLICVNDTSVFSYLQICELCVADRPFEKKPFWLPVLAVVKGERERET